MTASGPSSSPLLALAVAADRRRTWPPDRVKDEALAEATRPPEWDERLTKEERSRVTADADDSPPAAVIGGVIASSERLRRDTRAAALARAAAAAVTGLAPSRAG